VGSKTCIQKYQTEKLMGKNNLVWLEYRYNEFLRNACELDSPPSEQELSRRQTSRVHKATKFLVQLDNFELFRENQVTPIFVHRVTKYSDINSLASANLGQSAGCNMPQHNAFASTNARLTTFVSTDVLK
jgi:hypothetical protein